MPKSIKSDSDYSSKLEALVELAHILKQESDFNQILQIITEKSCGLFVADFALLMMKGSSLGMYFFLIASISAGCFSTSFKYELFGGILQFCEGMGFLLLLLLYLGWTSRVDLLITLLIGIPLSLSGFFFISAWYLEKYQKK